MSEALKHFQAAPALEVRSEAAREIYGRLLEWGVPAETDTGPELVEAGALDHVDVASVYMRLDHTDPLTGRMTALESRADGPYGTFEVARTARGDEQLELVKSGLYKGLSVGFVPHPPDGHRTINGRRVAVRKRLDLKEVSVTWRPAHAGASILAIRADQSEGTMETAEIPQAAEAAPALATGAAALDAFENRLHDLEERARKVIELPNSAPGGRPMPSIHKGHWASVALRSMAGERIPELELRALADVVTTTNLGVVPEQYRTELLGIIDPQRPFLQSTRQVPAGDSGMTINVPRIVQRPIVGLQAAEKAELASRATIIDSVAFQGITVGGAGDLSLQVIHRSSPSFLNLWVELLGEALAHDVDDRAVDALLAAGIEDGGTFDPASPTFGGAFLNAVAAGRSLRPDRIWFSTAAMAAFIDAKEPAGGGGRPLYPGLAQITGMTSAGNGNGPLPITMTPVHVPALDDEAVDVIVGPSRGFAWAEDGSYTLEADVPSKAGRDVGIATMLWLMPLYPAAFTGYVLPAAG